jgi:hypothetical protein
MDGIAKALSVKDSADVASYFAGRPGGLPAVTGLRVPEAGRTLQQSNPAIRLVFAGDPARGIAPCSACQGPGSYKLGAPALQHPARSSAKKQGPGGPVKIWLAGAIRPPRPFSSCVRKFRGRLGKTFYARLCALAVNGGN